MNFEKLLSEKATKKQQTTVKKFIDKGFKPTKQSDWQSFNELVFDLFVAGNDKAVQACLDYVFSLGYPYPDAEHKIDHLCWNLMWRMYHLKFYLSDKTTQKQMREQFLEVVFEQKLQQQIKQDAGKHDDATIKTHAQANFDKWLVNSCDYQLVESTRADYNDTDNTPKERYEWGLHLLGDYCSLLFFREESTNNQPKLIAEMGVLMEELRVLYKQINKIK